MRTINVVAKKDVKYVFRNSKRLLNMKVGDRTTLTLNEMFNMGSLYHFFFTESNDANRVTLFNDDPEHLLNKWQERNLV